MSILHRYDERINNLQHRMLVLEHKDRWSSADRDLFDNLRFECTKLKTLRAIDAIESMNELNKGDIDFD